MTHLTSTDYRTMPWSNGRGQTIELLRVEDKGALRCRLSMATVTEDGPFSIFPGIERNLTVIDGPGFDLVGALTVRAAPLVPLAFPGDVPLSAQNVTGISIDFNVMTARSLPRPQVTLALPGPLPRAPGVLCLFALEPLRAEGLHLARHDLWVGAGALHLETGRALAVWLPEGALR